MSAAEQVVKRSVFKWADGMKDQDRHGRWSSGQFVKFGFESLNRGDPRACSYKNTGTSAPHPRDAPTLRCLLELIRAQPGFEGAYVCKMEGRWVFYKSYKSTGIIGRSEIEVLDAAMEFIENQYTKRNKQ